MRGAGSRAPPAPRGNFAPSGAAWTCIGPAARLALGLPSDRPLLTFVGQVKREKGVLDLVDAMGLLGRELPPERLPLLLVIGTPSPPTIVEEIRRRAAAGGVAGSVRM